MATASKFRVGLALLDPPYRRSTGRAAPGDGTRSMSNTVGRPKIDLSSSANGSSVQGWLSAVRRRGRGGMEGERKFVFLRRASAGLTTTASFRPAQITRTYLRTCPKTGWEAAQITRSYLRTGTANEST